MSSNGGAGATGLIRALCEDFLQTVPIGSIEWVCNHSRNTQLALLEGDVDIALTYERDQELLAESEGWSRTIGCAFHDHFVVAGPSSDPAGIRHAKSPEHAFSSIEQCNALFHSRADASATMWKERSIWTRSGTEPRSIPTTEAWYKTSLLSPSEALVAADIAGAYLLTDRSTLLRQTASESIHNTTVFFEPSDPDGILMNSCYVSISTRQNLRNSDHIDQFLAYLLGEAGQSLIKSFGQKETGFSLFAPSAHGCASTKLIDGLPRDGRWTHDNSDLGLV